MQDNSNRLLRLNAAAQRFGVPRAWLREEALAGHLPHINVRGNLFFEPDLLESALKAVLRSGGEAANKDCLEAPLSGEEASNE